MVFKWRRRNTWGIHFHRVALAPAAVTALTKKGFSVAIEDGAGNEAKYINSAYEEAGAKVVDRKSAFAAGKCCEWRGYGTADA